MTRIDLWSMRSEQLFSILVTALVGGLIGYWIRLRGDRLAKKRDLRIHYLIEAYRRLENAVHRTPASRDNESALESAVADIQLFGSEEQVRLATAFAREFAKHGSAGLDKLLESLRCDLRAQLDLRPISANITHLRITPARSK
jgi:hypothetical protein